ncbi:5-formyltetrahydrofolate cyclo-ligase [Marinobacter lipolyticus]|uniref:5-formyltetrahydrofolate cyclo-ligase n=1 Tax=Marinobacter lipolyticus TaxID=209639 RepID=UPI001BCF9F61|nr:5-formyltetrahydrofolate cyclo-ligase [Marinobacter lipolyticus]MBS8240277.1 5-formyltetrahydrofolate cyclo-ligase [Marinobacter lipolyticus]
MTQFIPPQPFPPLDDDLPRNELRKRLRRRRQALSFEQQQEASEYLAINLLNNPDLHRARHIALYLPNDGEIDPNLYMDLARRRHVQFYLPVLHPILPGRLVFSPYHDGVELTANRFGIPEPAFSKGLKRPAWALDAVLFPLVGFDESGGRLGMGGGFYDRTFAFTRSRPRLAPKLIGIAHEFQKVARLPTEAWDVPLHSIVTDRHCYRVR